MAVLACAPVRTQILAIAKKLEVIRLLLGKKGVRWYKIIKKHFSDFSIMQYNSGDNSFARGSYSGISSFCVIVRNFLLEYYTRTGSSMTDMFQ